MKIVEAGCEKAEGLVTEARIACCIVKNVRSLLLFERWGVPSAILSAQRIGCGAGETGYRRNGSVAAADRSRPSRTAKGD